MGIRKLQNYIADNQLAAASVLARELLTQNPEQGDIWKVLSVVQRRLGSASEAIEALEQAARFLPQDTEVRVELINGLFHTRQWERAEHACRQLISQCSELPQPYLVLGNIADQRRQPDQAERFYNKALVLDDQQLLARANVGLIAMHRGDLPEAMLHFRKGLEILLATEQGQPTAKRPASPPFDQTKHEALLWQTLAQLAAQGVNACATAGTLLGLVREGALLPFDKDIDMALPFEQMAQAEACLLQHGWHKLELPLPLENPVAFAHSASGLTLDLCGVKIEAGSGQLIGGSWMAGLPEAWQRITEFPPFELVLQEGPAGPVWMFKEPERWLSALYGDWRTPEPDFDTIVCAANQRGFSLLSQCYAGNRMIFFWHSGKLSKALSIARYCVEQQPDDRLYPQIVARLGQIIEAGAAADGK